MLVRPVSDDVEGMDSGESCAEFMELGFLKEIVGWVESSEPTAGNRGWVAKTPPTLQLPQLQLNHPPNPLPLRDV